MNRLLLATTLLSATFAIAGCGERRVTPQTDGSIAADTIPPSTDSSPPTAKDATIHPPPSGACIVAVHYGTCCPAAVLVSEAELAADPCTVRWPAQRPPQCQSTCGGTCPAYNPPSRLAERGADGACHFVDECQKDEDCAIRVNPYACCDCGGAYPLAFLSTNPCFNGDKAHCDNVCAPGQPMCDCAAPFGDATCQIGDALNRCVFGGR